MNWNYPKRDLLKNHSFLRKIKIIKVLALRGYLSLRAHIVLLLPIISEQHVNASSCIFEDMRISVLQCS